MLRILLKKLWDTCYMVVHRDIYRKKIAHATNSNAIPGDARKLIEEKRDIPYREIAKVMADGQKEGTITDGDTNELAVVFWTSINGLAIYNATRQGSKTVPDPRILINTFLKKDSHGTEN